MDNKDFIGALNVHDIDISKIRLVKCGTNKTSWDDWIQLRNYRICELLIISLLFKKIFPLKEMKPLKIHKKKQIFYLNCFCKKKGPYICTRNQQYDCRSLEKWQSGRGSLENC
jgi:hypothetical protein